MIAREIDDVIDALTELTGAERAPIGEQPQVSVPVPVLRAALAALSQYRRLETVPVRDLIEDLRAREDEPGFHNAVLMVVRMFPRWSPVIEPAPSMIREAVIEAANRLTRAGVSVEEP